VPLLDITNFLAFLTGVLLRTLNLGELTKAVTRFLGPIVDGLVLSVGLR